MDAFGFRRQASSKKMSWHLLADIQVFTSPIQSSNGSQLQLRIAWIPVVLVIQFLIVIHHYLSFGRIISSSKCFYPHLCVGFLFLILYPAASAGSSSSSSASSPSSITHNFFVTHHLSHTSLSHTTLSPTMFHIQLCHTPSHTQLCHTPLSHKTLPPIIFHTQLCHPPCFTYNFVTHHHTHTTLSHTFVTQNFATHHLSHTTLSHTIFHTQLCHTPSSHTTLSHTIFHTQLCHPSSFTHNFVTHHLSHTTLSHTIFHTQLCHIQLCHTELSHTPSFFVTHHLSHQLCHKPSFATPSFTHHFVTHHLSHTTLSHALFHTHTTFTHTSFHTQLCHTHTHTIFLRHTPSFTYNFVTNHLSLHHLSHTTLSHTIFHTQLCHTLSFTHTHTTFTHTIFHTQLCHTHYLSWSHTIFHIQLCHIQLCFTCRSSTTSFVFPSFPVPATTFPLASSFGSQWAQSRSVAISPGSRTGTVAREILMAMEPQPSWLMLQGARLNWLNLKLDPKNVEDIMSYPVIIIIYQLNCRSSMCVFRGLTEKQENTCQWMSCQPQKHASEILPVGCCSWFSWCPKFKDLSQVSQKMEGKQ